MANAIILCLTEQSIREHSEDVKEEVFGDITGDYRYVQLQNLQRGLQISSDVTFVDIGSLSLDTMDASTINALLDANQLSQKECETIYFSAFILDLKRVFRFLNLFLQYLSQISPGRASKPQLIILEDLIYVPRAYIYENSAKNFFRNSLTLIDRYPLSVSCISLQSSNEVLNRWGEGDSYLVALPEIKEDAETVWSRIHAEISFEEMFMQGNAVPRLIAIQSIRHPEYGYPIYRHPNDEEPINQEMAPITHYLREQIETATGITGLNHVLIQFYRDGRDNIASHSDKTLDIDLSTPIINLSIGNTREMYLQNKQNKLQIEKIPMQHGECVIFGLQTNRYWWHEVPKNVLLGEHPVFGTGRVSFTFRKIVTYYHPDLKVLIGQGSPYKTIDQVPQQLTSTEIEETSSSQVDQKSLRLDLIKAFSKENKQSQEFIWSEVYGSGFLCK